MVASAVRIVAGSCLLTALTPLLSCTSKDGQPLLHSSIQERQLHEISGIVRGTSHYWVHNDSGDEPRIFALDDDSHVFAEVHVTGARAVDWEDIATAPAPQGTGRVLYIADTGNNLRDRKKFVVYRVIEPTLPKTRPARPLRSPPATALRFRFAGGTFDCEALIATPDDSALFLFTKERGGAGLYQLDVEAASDGTLQVLPRKTTVRVLEEITGADLNVSGTEIVLSTSHRLYRFTGIRAGAIPDALSGRGKPFASYTAQIEAVCYGAGPGYVVAVAEGYPAPVYHVPLSPTGGPDLSPR